MKKKTGEREEETERITNQIDFYIFCVHLGRIMGYNMNIMKNFLTLLFLIICNYSFAQADTTLSKTVKDLTAMVAGSYGGRIEAAKFKAAGKIEIAGGLKDSVVVTSYTFYATGKGFESGPELLLNLKGNLFAKEVIELMQKSRPGTTIVIDDIKVRQLNVTKRVPSITFHLY